MANKTIISIIVAMANGNVIGKNNKMPWHLPEDLALFKRITLGKPVVMGRKTFESIGKALPGRHNIVVSRSDHFHPDGVTIVHDLDQAIQAAGSVPEIMLIGGANIYAQMLNKVDRLYLSQIDLKVDGDAFFPEWQASDWRQTDSKYYEGYGDTRPAWFFQQLERRGT